MSLPQILGIVYGENSSRSKKVPRWVWCQARYYSFFNIMCATSSLNATYFFNHTLWAVSIWLTHNDVSRSLGICSIIGIIPGSLLLNLIELNGRTHDKKVVIHENILQYHLQCEHFFGCGVYGKSCLVVCILTANHDFYIYISPWLIGIGFEMGLV